jgi:GTP-binding protein
MLKVAIVGKPNVGKTTLFNKLYKKKISIVQDTPGVTRDRKEEIIELFDLQMLLMDTAGLDLITKNSNLNKQIKEQIFDGIKLSDIVLFVVDGKNGITQEDLDVYNIVRRFNKKLILVINKCDAKKSTFELGDFPFYDNYVHISAEHKLGFDDLYLEIKKYHEESVDENQPNEQEEINSDSIKIAFIGRPNAGKSTIINKILQKNRLIVDDVAGTTRDSIYIPFKYKEQNLTLIDTAGIRKKKNIVEDIESESVDISFKAIDLTNICIMMIDIKRYLEAQDLALINQIIKEARILMLVFNKIDTVSGISEEELAEEIKTKIQSTIPDIQGLNFFICSALKENNFDILLDNAIKLYENSKVKIKTNKLTNWGLELNKYLPKINGKQIKIKYVNQTHTFPQRFTFYMNKSKIPEQHLRFIKKKFVQEFEVLQGLVIRVFFKKVDDKVA